jgi:hypothetical protein
MPFELARLNFPNIAAVIAMALTPLIALPMQRHQSNTAKVEQVQVQQIQVQAVEQSAPVNVAYAIFD